ncbi:hypothetical protein BC567DRAFT_213692 [Phyllosticta citribraziliensis]
MSFFRRLRPAPAVPLPQLYVCRNILVDDGQGTTTKIRRRIPRAEATDSEYEESRSRYRKKHGFDPPWTDGKDNNTSTTMTRSPQRRQKIAVVLISISIGMFLGLLITFLFTPWLLIFLVPPVVLSLFHVQIRSAAREALCGTLYSIHISAERGKRLKM